MVVFDRCGGIYPCELTDIPGESIGNIYDDKDLIQAVTKSIDNAPFFREKWAKKCADCPWYCFCKGGCTIHTMADRRSEIDEIECAVNTVLYPALIELILTKPEVVNQMLGFDALRI